MRSVLRCLLAGVVSCSAIGATARADVLEMTDGTRLEGKVRREADGRWMVFVHGRPVFVASSDIRSITLTPPAVPTTQQADDRLQSLRRSVADLGDLDQIIARYQLFLNRVKQPEVLSEANQDLANYQGLAAAHAVEVDGSWLTPAQVQARLAAGPPPVEAARLALKQNRPEDARAALATAALLTPNDPAVAYLTSLLELQQNDLEGARPLLNALLVQLPDHAPTLNNLAVVQWRQHQVLAALSSYDAALTAAPQSAAVLHNVAAALATVPAPLNATPVFDQLSTHYQQQDRALVASMAQQGMQRFGESWVSDAQMQQIEQHRQVVQQQLDAISDRFDTVRRQIEELDRRRADLVADRRRTSGFGPAPFSVYGGGLGTGDGASSSLASDLADDERADHLQRRLLVNQLDTLTTHAKALQAEIAPPEVDRQQRLIGVEGTPFVMPAAAATPVAAPPVTPVSTAPATAASTAPMER